MDILKDLGKGQMAVIAQGINDSRWFVVRNIVNILAETGSEQAIPFLEKVLDHKNVHIRQEVIKGLVSIGGKRAASLVARYLMDRDPDIRLMALRSLGTVKGAGPDEAQALMEFLEKRHISKEENDVTIEAIRILGKIGKLDAMTFLERYNKIRWWRSRRPQEEVRAAARATTEEIRRRLDRDGRTS
jgi:HEAT repeat protein